MQLGKRSCFSLDYEIYYVENPLKSLSRGMHDTWLRLKATVLFAIQVSRLKDGYLKPACTLKTQHEVFIRSRLGE